MKKQIIQVKNKKINIADIEVWLKKCSAVSAAYLFGSAAQEESVVNDLDILVLLKKLKVSRLRSLAVFRLDVKN